ncbi:hypothetical protein MMC20_004618 [Loxospora ochrophaea]|nr:hypothetical protein [Loxospora ochrophaea]
MEEGSTAASSPPSTYDHQVREKEERSPARPSSSQGSDSDRDEVLPFAVQRQANRFKRAVAQHVSHLHLEHGKRSREVTPEQCLEKSFHRLCLELDDDNEDGGATILDRTAPVLRGQAPLFGAGVTFLAGGNPGVARETPTPVENACVTEKVPFPSSKTLVPASKAPVPASKTPVPASKTPVPEKKAPIHTGRPSIGPPAFLGAPIGILTPAKVYPHGPSNAVLKDRTLLPNRGGDPFVAGRRRNLKTRKGKKGKKEEQDNEEDWVSEED